MANKTEMHLETKDMLIDLKEQDDGRVIVHVEFSNEMLKKLDFEQILSNPMLHVVLGKMNELKNEKKSTTQPD